jgi:hypothetical protein
MFRGSAGLKAHKGCGRKDPQQRVGIVLVVGCGSPSRLPRHGPYLSRMSVQRELRRRMRLEESIPRFEPCLPRPAREPPAGPDWIHEIKHDGFR